MRIINSAFLIAIPINSAYLMHDGCRLYEFYSCAQLHVSGLVYELIAMDPLTEI